MKSLLWALSLLAISAPVLADQCLVVTPDQAKAAAALVTPGGELARYCKLCDDRQPSKATVDTVQVSRVSQAEIEGLDSVVIINGKAIDLANSFVKTGPDTYTNLARMVGCPVVETPGFIAVR